MAQENSKNEALKALCAEHGITFEDGKFEMHMNFENHGVRVDSFAIKWPNNPCDGKRVARQVDTPKTKNAGWGKGEICFYLSGEYKSPEFPDMEKFIEHYAKQTVKTSPEPTEPIVRVKAKKSPTSKPSNDDAE